MIDDKFIHNMATEFFVAAINFDGEKGHELTHVMMHEGDEFAHDFVGAIYFHIHMFNHFIISKYPEAAPIIHDLCEKLKNPQATNICKEAVELAKHLQIPPHPDFEEDDNR